jgi:hypothetical protein
MICRSNIGAEICHHIATNGDFQTHEWDVPIVIPPVPDPHLLLRPEVIPLDNR